MVGLELCAEYNLDDPEQFVDKWMAFSINKFAGSEPTLQYLTDFENNELKNKNPSAKTKRLAVPERSQIKVYHQESEDEENDLLGNYVCITPKVSQKSRNSQEFSPSLLCDLRSNAFKTIDKHEHSRLPLIFQPSHSWKTKSSRLPKFSLVTREFN